MKKVRNIILSIVGVLLLLFVAAFVMLRVNSPGKLKSLVDESGQVIEGSLSEKNRVEIGGIEQGFFIRGENPGNPVILYLHGGPGSPELPLIEATEKSERLEKYFTICYWDQRGAGMTYSKDTDPASATVEQFVEDTREMTEYLLNRFGKNKVYLMGHSWGSYLGVKTVEKYPDCYYAYIGIGQVTNQLLSERLAYSYMMDYAQEMNDKKAIKDLSKFAPDAADFPSEKYLLGPRIEYMNKYGIGITHESASMSELTKDILSFKGYTVSEKIGYAKGSLFSLENVFYYVIDDNLFESSTSFQVPIFIIHGVYDYQVSYGLAKEWVDFIDAPDKRLYTFENSAHSPNMEEPEQFVAVVREIADKYGEHLNDDYEF